MSLLNVTDNLFDSGYDLRYKDGWRRGCWGNNKNWVSKSIVFLPIDVIIEMVSSLMFCQNHNKNTRDESKSNADSHCDTSTGEFEGWVGQIVEIVY